MEENKITGCYKYGMNKICGGTILIGYYVGMSEDQITEDLLRSNKKENK